MSTVDETSTQDQDTTPRQRLETLLKSADALVASADAMQNPVASALRNLEAGKVVDVDEVLSAAQKHVAELERQARKFAASGQRQEIQSVSGLQLVDDYWPRIASCKEAISTPFGRLNDVLSGGLEPQRLVVLLGAPGGGKTTMANHIAVHAADAGRPVFYVTSEDLPSTLLAKTLARKGPVDYKAVLKGYESEREQITKVLKEYRASLAAERLHYLDTSMMVDMEAIKDLAAAHFEKYKSAGQGILVIDYLQRLARSQAAYRDGNRDLRQAVTVITEQLRSFANELDCCVLALAAQHRASGYGVSSNSLSSAKESGDIEYTADIMMAIGEDQDRIPSTSWLKPRILRIDKNRQGENDVTIPFDWYGSRQQFTEVSQEEYNSNQEPVASNGRGKRGSR